MSSLMLNRSMSACFAVFMFLLSTLAVAPAQADGQCAFTVEVLGGYYTAALVNPTPEELELLGSVVDATGCDIGIYFNRAGSVNGVEVFGATHWGIVNYAAAVDVAGSSIHDNEVGIYFFHEGVTGTIDGNIVSGYEKYGIWIHGSGTMATITDNVVTGLGPAGSYAGIWIGPGTEPGPSGYLKGNEISGNEYGILGGFAPPPPAPQKYAGATLIAENNNVHHNQVSILFYGDGYYNLCTTTQLTKNNIHHSEVGIAIMCAGWYPPADPLTIDDNNIHHNTEPLEWDGHWPGDVICTWVESGYAGYAWIGLNHMHRNGWDEPPFCSL